MHHLYREKGVKSGQTRLDGPRLALYLYPVQQLATENKPGVVFSIFLSHSQSQPTTFAIYNVYKFVIHHYMSHKSDHISHVLIFSSADYQILICILMSADFHIDSLWSNSFVLTNFSVVCCVAHLL